MPTNTPARTVRPGTTVIPLAIIAAGGRRVPLVHTGDGTYRIDPDADIGPFLSVGMDWSTGDGETVTVPPIAARREG